MKTILDPVDENWEVYEKDIERTIRSLRGYEEQFGKSFNNSRSLIEYVAELLAYHRSEVRFWKDIVMVDIMEKRKLKRKNLKNDQ